MKPRFSVLIPVYNRQEFVREAIDSVLAQKYEDYELIAVDDGSTDRTPEALKSYGNTIRTIRQTHQGPEVARNTAASAATGQYLVFLDSDDLLLPSALGTYQSLIDNLDFPRIIIGKMAWFTGRSRPAEATNSPHIASVFVFRDYLAKSVPVSISYSVIVVRRDLFNKVGGLRPGSFPLDDIDLMLRVGTSGPCAIVETPQTVGYRSHADNCHLAFGPMMNAISYVVKAESAGEYPGGWKRALDRHSYIGGICWSWVRQALKWHNSALAARILIERGPTILVGAFRKIVSMTARSSRPQVIPIRSDENGDIGVV